MAPLLGKAREDAEAAALRGVIGREQDDANRFQQLMRKAPLLASLVIHGDSIVDNASITNRVDTAARAAWARDLKLPPYVLDTQAPASLQMLRLHPGSDNQRAPVLPTLFMPGFPKSATSWLYECLLHAFNPESVGCGRKAVGWTGRKCRHRFALTALYSGACIALRNLRALLPATDPSQASASPRGLVLAIVLTPS
jgi:hypothetical protein